MQDEVTLEVLGDEALMDLQLSLAAYTQIVMKSLCDTMPKLVYNQLVTKVCPCISSPFLLKASCHTHLLALSSARLTTVISHMSVLSTNSQDFAQAGLHCMILALHCSATMASLDINWRWPRSMLTVKCRQLSTSIESRHDVAQFATADGSWWKPLGASIQHINVGSFKCLAACCSCMDCSWRCWI